MSFLDVHERLECVKEGERRALSSIYERLFKDKYKQAPTAYMAQIEAEIDDLREANRRDYVLFTLNPFDTTEESSLREVCEEISRRMWIDCFDYEIEWGKETGHIHAHMLFHVKKPYGPAAMRQMFMRNVKISGMVGSELSLDIKKIPRSDISRVRDYIHKSSVSFLPLTSDEDLGKKQ